MKNLILICFVFTSFQIEARMVLPRVCKENNWAEVYVYLRTPPDSSGKHPIRRPTYPTYPTSYCILPDGNYYQSWDIKRDRDGKFKKLIKKYTGKYPSFEQIENAKEKMKLDGLNVN